jgi:hypothetical protein
VWQVRVELAARGAKVSVAVFWGRERYVSILWRYLERNLAANGGIVDEVRWGATPSQNALSSCFIGCVVPHPYSLHNTAGTAHHSRQGHTLWSLGRPRCPASRSCCVRVKEGAGAERARGLPST